MIIEELNNGRKFDPIACMFTFESIEEISAMWHFLNSGSEDRKKFFESGGGGGHDEKNAWLLGAAKSDCAWYSFNTIVKNYNIKIL